jgi:hypothetical protein
MEFQIFLVEPLPAFMIWTGNNSILTKLSFMSKKQGKKEIKRDLKNISFLTVSAASHQLQLNNRDKQPAGAHLSESGKTDLSKMITGEISLN